jgi:Uma2 family endonuclease
MTWGFLMSATTRLSFQEFLQLPDEPGKRFELRRGELVVEPSPALRHNAICFRIARHLQDFVYAHRLGLVTTENDFRLGLDVVLRPDVAFIATEPLSRMDVDLSPIEGAPNLAIEVISPGNSAEKMLTKIQEYLRAGCQAVWVFYAKQKVVEIHDLDGIRSIAAPALLEEEKLFAGYRYSLPLAPVFDEDITR